MDKEKLEELRLSKKWQDRVLYHSLTDTWDEAKNDVDLNVRFEAVVQKLRES